MMRLLAKYRTIFVLCLVERFTYRTDFFLGTLMRFLPIVTTIFLWQAVYAGMEQTTPASGETGPTLAAPQSAPQPEETRIAGLTRRQMVAYYLLVMVGRAFSSMPGLAEGIAYDIREGHIKRYLIQPVSMLGYLLTARISHKLVYYTIATGPFALVFYLCRHYFGGWPETHVLLVFLASLVLAFVIGFLFETLVGLIAFWTLEISSFNFIIITLSYLLSGHMFPLDLVPGTLGVVLQWLPFQYLAYFPAMVFLHGGSMSGAELTWALGKQCACALILYLMVRLAYSHGLRRYSAFGG